MSPVHYKALRHYTSSLHDQSKMGPGPIPYIRGKWLGTSLVLVHAHDILNGARSWPYSLSKGEKGITCNVWRRRARRGGGGGERPNPIVCLLLHQRHHMHNYMAQAMGCPKAYSINESYWEKL